MKRWTIFLAFFLIGLASVWAETADVKGEAEIFSRMYFAPMDGGMNFCRLYHPNLGMVEFRRRERSFIGAAGWSAEMEAPGIIAVRSPSSPCVYRFRDGNPDILEINGRKIRLDVEETPTIADGIADMWEGAEEEAVELHAKKWPGRFAPLYGNPNKSVVLFASIFLVFMWIFLYFDNPVAVVVGLVGCALFGFLTVKTGARAGCGAAALGAVILWLARFLRKGCRWRLSILGLAGVVAVAFLLLGGKAGRLTSGFGDRGNVWRMEIWRATPQMMVDAPWGWPTSSGRAYGDWYQQLKSNYVAPTLVSDHLTYMVGLGWIGRFLWLFGWFALFAVLGRNVFRGGTPLPLALLLALALTAMFNPILHDWTLWLIPLASMWFFVRLKPWHEWRIYRFPIVFSAMLSLAACGAFYFFGRGPASVASPSVYTDGKCVFVGSTNPQAWIVDDRATVGWLFAPREIRSFFRMFPNAPSLGYAETFRAVPDKVRRLAIASGKCREYIGLWLQGKAPKADELVFLSPEMPLKDIPIQLRQSCKFCMVIGEFAARYVNVYGTVTPSDNVVVEKGAEVYLPRWIGFTLGVPELFQ